MRSTYLIAACRLAALVALAIPLNGCGDDDASGSIVRVSNWLNAAVDPEFFKLERALESEYEAAHSGVDLRIEPIPGVGQYAPKLLLAHASRSIADAGYLDASSGALFIDNHVAADLMPFIQGDPVFRIEDYFPGAVEPFRRDGKLFAIPQDFTPMVLFYNKKLFDEIGEPYPHDGWTIAEFLAVARKLTRAADADRPAQFGRHFENIAPFWILWLWSAGGDVLSADGKRAAGALDSPKTVAAFEFILDLMYTHGVAPTLQQRASIGQDLFLTGRAAMDVKGHWMLVDYRPAGLEVGVVSVPTGLDRPVTVLYQTGLAVWARGRHPRLGWEWVKYNTSRDVQIRRTAGGVAISANRQAAAHYAADPIEAAFQRQIEFARPAWGVRVERYPYVEELVTKMFEDMAYAVARSSQSDGRSDGAAMREIIQRHCRDAAQRIDIALRN